MVCVVLTYGYSSDLYYIKIKILDQLFFGEILFEELETCNTSLTKDLEKVSPEDLFQNTNKSEKKINTRVVVYPGIGTELYKRELIWMSKDEVKHIVMDFGS
ncbi:hypothetical protein FRX31_017492 [Thalictrum thalictroides]|uniref:Uncharacterized protein n=1 Tax=Thalictrum thalictroides TaxID=46969 RepID=A0A7J6W6A3_THATH|nr:hypothetical protein FRX31_017492 [Thalictrum thalictroides]